MFFTPSLEFQWPVCAAGYAWRTSYPTANPKQAVSAIVPADLDAGEKAAPARRYRPLGEVSGLFRIFAELKPEPEDILKFASEFGLLGVGEDLCEASVAKQIPKQLTADDAVNRKLVFRGELQESWEENIAEMKFAVMLWDASRAGDEATLCEFVAWIPGSEFGEATDELRPVIRQPLTKPKVTGTFRLPSHFNYVPGDLVGPARDHVATLINRHTSGGKYGLECVTSTDHELVVGLVPRNLRDALWLQFSWAVEQKLEFRRCERCQRPFALSPETARTNRVYCSDTCKMAAYQDRKAKARELAAAGKSPADIAKILNSTAATVKGWIGSKPKGRKKDGT